MANSDSDRRPEAPTPPPPAPRTHPIGALVNEMNVDLRRFDKAFRRAVETATAFNPARETR